MSGSSARRSWRALLLGTVLVVGACSLSARAMVWRQPSNAPQWRDVRALGTLDPVISESSGLVASPGTPSRFWTHNDSDNAPEVYAIDSTGRLIATVRLDGVINEDWEALAAGPCPGGTCLYLGDVGDNFARRETIRLLRFAEPAAEVAPSRRGVPRAAIETRTVRFPEGAHDVEALFVAADSSVWLITKRPDWLAVRAHPARLYRVPASAWREDQDRPVVAESAGMLPVRPGRLNAHEWITDASLSTPLPDGSRRLAVLTYGALYLFATDPQTGRPGARLARCLLPIPEHDPEAVAWRADGSLLLTNEGRGSTVYAGRCP